MPGKNNFGQTVKAMPKGKGGIGKTVSAMAKAKKDKPLGKTKKIYKVV
tara:strand:+ start:1010 stop:1153 length:144 start_codon:yes stop_codon:yes gene_type:complete